MEKCVIQNEFLRAEISLKGAELKGLSGNGVEYVWKGNPKYWNRSAPFLFPVVGTLKDKETYFDGKLYKMGSHGFLRDQVFEVLSQKEDEVILVNVFNEETLAKYPFKYKAIVTYKLIEKSLKTEVEIYNLDLNDMPFNIGGHPAFNCPMFEGDTFEDYSIHFEKEETFVSPFVESNATLNFGKAGCTYQDLRVLDLKKDLFDIDTIVIPRVRSKKVKLLNKNGKGVEFEYPKFSTFAIWTPFNDAPFVCLEPWIGYNDRHDSNKDFLTKDNLITLKSLESYKVDYTIKIVE